MKLSQAIKAMVATGTVVMSASAMAVTTHGDNRATLQLEGQVDRINHIEIVDDNGADSIRVWDDSLQPVGTVLFASNDADGFEVTVSSKKGGLENRDRTDYVLPYRLVFERGELNFPGGVGSTQLSRFNSADLSETNEFTRRLFSGNGFHQGGTLATNDISIRMLSTTNIAGTYKDTVTFTIADI